VLSKTVPILGEGIACNQDPDSLQSLKTSQVLSSIHDVNEDRLDIIPIFFKLWNCWSFVLILYIPDC
jgi:hypothetical protein